MLRIRMDQSELAQQVNKTKPSFVFFRAQPVGGCGAISDPAGLVIPALLM